MSMVTSNSSLYGLDGYTDRICNGMYVYCDGRCTNCARGIVLVSNRDQTTNDTMSIHIVKRPPNTYNGGLK